MVKKTLFEVAGQGGSGGGDGGRNCSRSISYRWQDNPGISLLSVRVFINICRSELLRTRIITILILLVGVSNVITASVGS